MDRAAGSHCCAGAWGEMGEEIMRALLRTLTSIRLTPMRLQRFTALALFALGLLPAAARAQTTDAGKADAPTPKAERLSADPSAGSDYWRLMGSPYTVHWHKDENNEHKPVYMIGLERQRSDGWVWGGVYFSNSFGQPSGYVYVGEKVPGFTRWEKLFFQWTAGVLYGYGSREELLQAGAVKLCATPRAILDHLAAGRG